MLLQLYHSEAFSSCSWCRIFHRQTVFCIDWR